MSERFLELWYDALRDEHGCIISVSDLVRCRSALYRARAQAGDPALDRISLRTSPFHPESELWLVKEKPNGSAAIHDEGSDLDSESE